MIPKKLVLNENLHLCAVSVCVIPGLGGSHIRLRGTFSLISQANSATDISRIRSPKAIVLPGVVKFCNEVPTHDKYHLKKLVLNENLYFAQILKIEISNLSFPCVGVNGLERRLVMQDFTCGEAPVQLQTPQYQCLGMT